MARANRHYIPGQIWHITHRCHKRDFLLKLIKDRRRWMQWLFAAKRRYGLIILNYTITSNHIHLLVLDKKGREVIPDSIKLIAGRTAQEYNQRKKRKGAFWEERYHATAVESDQHLMRCLVYIDLNMVRAGVVSHPSEWPFCGYNEIQSPWKKSVLIAYETLAAQARFKDYESFHNTHKILVDETLTQNKNNRNVEWTESIAVGSKHFITTIKEQFGVLAIGRKTISDEDKFQLREPSTSYNPVFDVKNKDIGGRNTCLWDDITLKTDS